LKNDAAMAAQLAASLRYFWAFHGHVTEGASGLKQS
jgi:hypothetical protein